MAGDDRTAQQLRYICFKHNVQRCDDEIPPGKTKLIQSLVIYVKMEKKSNA